MKNTGTCRSSGEHPSSDMHRGLEVSGTDAAIGLVVQLLARVARGRGKLRAVRSQLRVKGLYLGRDVVRHR